MWERGQTNSEYKDEWDLCLDGCWDGGVDENKRRRDQSKDMHA